MDKTIVFYGAGNHARAHFKRWASEGSAPACVVDMDERKQGKMFFGCKVLSLQDAIASFPDYELHIALSDENKFACRDYLISTGIPAERIKFAGKDNADYKFGCEFLYEKISITPLSVMTCPDQFFGKRSSFNVLYSDRDTLKSALEENLRRRNEAVQALADNEKPPCGSCQHLRWGRFPEKPAVFRVSFSGAFDGEHCNLSCCYCNMQKHTKPSMRLIDAMRAMGEFFQGVKLNINFTTGEFFIKRDCDEILEFCRTRDYLVNFTTNGSVYRDAVAELAASGNIDHMNISLDSGTPETYAKIKGVDCFGRTVGNLEKYHELHIPLVLKYILLEGINDNTADIDAFFRIAGRLEASVAISTNQYVKNSRLKPESMDLIERLIHKCRSSGLTVIPYRDFFNLEDVRALDAILNTEFARAKG